MREIPCKALACYYLCQLPGAAELIRPCPLKPWRRVFWLRPTLIARSFYQLYKVLKFRSKNIGEIAIGAALKDQLPSRQARQMGLWTIHIARLAFMHVLTGASWWAPHFACELLLSEAKPSVLVTCWICDFREMESLKTTTITSSTFHFGRVTRYCTRTSSLYRLLCLATCGTLLLKQTWSWAETAEQGSLLPCHGWG